jgi:hypothetical protein
MREIGMFQAVPVSTSRELLQANLRTYGEDELAACILTLSDAEMNKIGEVADHYLYAPGKPPLLAKVVALAAVEVLEGASRPLKRNRRRLKGIYPGMWPTPNLERLG